MLVNQYPLFAVASVHRKAMLYQVLERCLQCLSSDKPQPYAIRINLYQPVDVALVRGPSAGALKFVDGWVDLLLQPSVLQFPNDGAVILAEGLALVRVRVHHLPQCQVVGLAWIALELVVSATPGPGVLIYSPSTVLIDELDSP